MNSPVNTVTLRRKARRNAEDSFVAYGYANDEEKPVEHTDEPADESLPDLDLFTNPTSEKNNKTEFGNTHPKIQITDYG